MNNAIQIKNLRFSYNKMTTLKNISLEIKKGDFFIVIGPNGSGKTTLMRLICGIEKNKKGEINILGKALNKYSKIDLAQKIAFVPQSIPSDFSFKAGELVLLGRSPYLGMLGIEGKKDMEIANNAMEFTGVRHLAERKLTELSGGERQRVFISRAICQEPSIILLDEPTASLDLAHQLMVMDLMKKLKTEKGITVVMVSHDINLAAMYGDNLLLLKKGSIESMGPPSKVITREILKMTYGCEVLVDKSPVGEFPRITLIPENFSK